MHKAIFFLALLIFRNETIYGQCALDESAMFNPAPFSNQYAPGTVVDFCYTIDGFSQAGNNWLHGVVLDFGAGWNLSTLLPTFVPSACDTNGYWNFYEGDTASGSGYIFGPGFYYDSNIGDDDPSDTCCLDGIPGNNFGEDCDSFIWTFCFSVGVDSNCSVVTDLHMNVICTGDGASGSWNNFMCSGQPFPILQGITCGANCIMTADVSHNEVDCFDACNGIAAVTVNNGLSPFSYDWSNGDTTGSVTQLCAGEYYVTVTDVYGCTSIDTIIILQPAELIINSGTDTILCYGTYFALGGNPAATGGIPPYQYDWTEIPFLNDPHPVIVVLDTQYYHLMVTDSNECVAFDSVLITMDLCDGIFQMSGDDFFEANPNPVSDLLFVEMHESQKEADLIVSDLFGRELLRRRVESVSEQVSLFNVPPGIYYLVLQSRWGSMKKILVKI